MEEFRKFAAEAKIDHAVIVAHPDLSGRPPVPGVLFEPRAFQGLSGRRACSSIDPATTKRLQALVGKSGRIVALRIDQMHERDAVTTGPPIKDRDLRDPQMAIHMACGARIGVCHPDALHSVPCSGDWRPRREV